MKDQTVIQKNLQYQERWKFLSESNKYCDQVKKLMSDFPLDRAYSSGRELKFSINFLKSYNMNKKIFLEAAESVLQEERFKFETRISSMILVILRKLKGIRKEIIDREIGRLTREKYETRYPNDPYFETIFQKVYSKIDFAKLNNY